jgi:rhodanese-related sulfurtransferase
MMGATGKKMSRVGYASQLGILSNRHIGPLTGLALIAILSVIPAQATDVRYNGIAGAAEVLQLAQEDKIQLVDIRRPEEWRQTGVGKPAHRISMHQSGFVMNIDALLDGDRTRPVALICARGGRSGKMKARLNALGFTNVTNISEGMLGSRAGPGWLKRKLPIRHD